MTIVWHIVRKDLAGLRWGTIAAVTCTLLLGVLTAAGQGLSESDTADFVQFAAVAAWILLSAQLIQSDRLAGTSPYWLTRPIRPGHVALAKAIYLGLFVLAPVGLSNLLSAAARGIPVTEYWRIAAWQTGAVFVFFLLPAAALAATAESLAQTGITVALAAAGSLAAPLLLASGQQRGEWHAVEWIRSASALGALALAAVIVLIVQYRWRRVLWARTVIAAGVVAATAAPVILTGTTAFAIQSAITGRLEAPLRFSANTQPDYLPANMGGIVINVPITITPSREGELIRVLDIDVTETNTGRRAGGHNHSRNGEVTTRFRYKRPELQDRLDQRVHLRGHIYVAVLSPSGRIQFPQPGPVVIPGFGVCAAPSTALLTCTNPGLRPVELHVDIDSASSSSRTNRSARDSLNPYPMEFGLIPLRGFAPNVLRTDIFKAGHAPGNLPSQLVLSTWTPTALWHGDFDMTGLTFGDYLQFPISARRSATPQKPQPQSPPPTAGRPAR